MEQDAIIAQMETLAQRFLYELREKTYLHFSGKSREYDLAGIYKKYKNLFAEATIDSILKVYDKNRNRKTKYLVKFILEGHIGQAVNEIDEEITKAEASGVIIYKKEKIPYRAILGKLFNTNGSDERHELDRLRREFIDQFNDMRRTRIGIVNDKAKSFGYRNYADLCEEFKEVRMDELHEECKNFSEETSSKYHKELSYYLERSGIEGEAVERSDMFFLARASDFDALFPSSKLLPAMEKTLLDFGIDLQEQKNILLDIEDQPSKAARPFCIAVDTPNDVRLVFRVRGGHEDFANLFHEMGHAQHFAHIDDSQPFAFKCLGDYAVTEGFAFLFQSLVSNPRWIRRHLESEAKMNKEYIKLADFLKLYLMRRYAAKLMYEYELFSKGMTEATASDYASIFSKYLGVRYWPEDYIVDIDVSFYCLNYIRAWTLEHQLKKQLENEFGKGWMFSKGAGDLLKTLWRNGQEHNADELCKRIGGESYSLFTVVSGF
jgi:hypothetical protein